MVSLILKLFTIPSKRMKAKTHYHLIKMFWKEIELDHNNRDEYNRPRNRGDYCRPRIAAALELLPPLSLILAIMSALERTPEERIVFNSLIILP